jgi:hypothetical protein
VVTRQRYAYESLASRLALSFERAKAMPVTDAWAATCEMKRTADAAVQELARTEEALRRTTADYTETARGLAAYSVVMAHLEAERLGLSVTPERGVCVLEQDGTTLHCAPTIGALADWCRAQRPTVSSPVGGFVDHMDRS